MARAAFRKLREQLPVQISANLSRARGHGHAYEFALTQRKSPREALRSTDADTRIGHNLDSCARARPKAMRRVKAQIDLMMTLRDIERLRQFPRSRTELPNVVDAAPFPHQRDAAPRLDRANEDEAVARAAFDKNIEHPMHAVVEINVGCTRFVAPNELARARPPESVTRFVVLGEIGFRLDDDAAAFFPDEFGADEIFRAGQRVGLKKCCRASAPACHRSPLAGESVCPTNPLSHFD